MERGMALGYDRRRSEGETSMRYKVNMQRTEEGYAVWVPGLPGCWSQGKTEEEAMENIKDAIQEYLHTVEYLSKDRESRYVEVG
jgi:predicted RNase H-like HicB family nuclease